MADELTENQEIILDLTERLFAEYATTSRLAEVEKGDLIYWDLWAELAKSNIIGLGLGEDVGGSSLSMAEIALVLNQQGRHVAPVPIASTVICALAIDRFASADVRQRVLPPVVGGEAVLGAALSEEREWSSVPATTAQPKGGSWLITGKKLAVPAATVAAQYLVPAVLDDGTVRVFLVEAGAPGLEVLPVQTTDRQLHGHLTMDGVAGVPLGGEETVGWLAQRMTVALCAIQCGVTRAALELTAAYVSQREQFGKPLAYFQGVVLQRADALIDCEAMQATTDAAVQRLVEGHDAPVEVAVAKWWASEGGHRVVHTATHLHGGMGNTLDYPLHRYYFWAKQIDVSLGGGPQQLATIGAELASKGDRDDVDG